MKEGDTAISRILRGDRWTSRIFEAIEVFGPAMAEKEALEVETADYEAKGGIRDGTASGDKGADVASWAPRRSPAQPKRCACSGKGKDGQARRRRAGAQGPPAPRRTFTMPPAHRRHPARIASPRAECVSDGSKRPFHAAQTPRGRGRASRALSIPSAWTILGAHKADPCREDADVTPRTTESGSLEGHASAC
jgi:hypothetical protein